MGRVTVLPTATTGDLRDEIVDSIEVILRRVADRRVTVRDGVLHLPIAVVGDDGAPDSRDVLRILRLQTSLYLALRDQEDRQ